jgi:thymidylate synthase
MVSAWNVGELGQMVLPPCHYGFQVYTRDLTLAERIKAARVRYPKFNTMDFGHSDGISEEEFQHHQIDEKYPGVPTKAISLAWNQRSVDVFLGLPFNIASYGLLLTIIAKEVDMVPDQLIGNLGDTHLYLNHLDQAKEQSKRKPFKLPGLLSLDEYHYLMDQEISFSEKIMGFRSDFFKLEGYESHPAIKAPLSN